MAEYMRARRATRRQALIELKGGQCEKCSSQSDLQFNHLDRTQKLFTLSGAGLDRAWSKILAEVEKCELVCEPCHLKYTAIQYSSGEIRPHNDKTGIPRFHGTARKYTEDNCRCVECKLAKKMYRNKELAYDQAIFPA